ncbi:MAG: hypothetical protein QNK40_00365 [Desulfobacterales bacterium]|nr:hypothetical protein [Desulfobacterales bacterium]
MKKVLIIAAMCLVIAAAPVFAHHPAADVVSDDVYAIIDEAVSQTPHVDMVFDDMSITAVEMTDEKITTYYFKSLGAKTNELVMLILNHASILEGEVEILIEYADESSETLTQTNEDPSESGNIWNEWGRPFYLTILQILPES